MTIKIGRYLSIKRCLIISILFRLLGRLQLYRTKGSCCMMFYDNTARNLMRVFHIFIYQRLRLLLILNLRIHISKQTTSTSTIKAQQSHITFKLHVLKLSCYYNVKLALYELRLGVLHYLFLVQRLNLRHGIITHARQN